MKIYRKKINGIKVSAYNDSNVEWVVQAGGFSAQRFPKNKFSMRDAMEFMAKVASHEK